MGAIGEAAGYLCDFVDGIVWSIPGTISNYLERASDSTRSRSRALGYGLLAEVISGTIELHHLPTTLFETPPENRENPSPRDYFTIDRSVRTLTMAAEVAGYALLAFNGHPEALAVPVVSNIMDSVEIDRDNAGDPYAHRYSPNWIGERYSLV